MYSKKTFAFAVCLCVALLQLVGCTTLGTRLETVSESERSVYRISAVQFTTVKKQTTQSQLNYVQVIYNRNGRYVLCIDIGDCDATDKTKVRSSDVLNILTMITEQPDLRFVRGNQTLTQATYFPAKEGAVSTVPVMQGRSTVGSCTIRRDKKGDRGEQYSERCDITVTVLKFPERKGSKETEPRGITTSGILFINANHELTAVDVGVAVFDNGISTSFTGKKE